MRLGEQQGAEHRAAVGPQAWRTVLGKDGDVGAEPSRVVAAAGKAPRPGQTITARRHPGLGWAGRTPGDNPAVPAEYLPRRLGRQKSGGHRAAARLAEAPRHAGVALCDFLDDRNIGKRRELGATEG